MTPQWSVQKEGYWEATLCTFDITLEVTVAEYDPDHKGTYYGYEVKKAGSTHGLFRSGRFGFNGGPELRTLEAAQQEAWAKACEWAGVEQ